MKPNKLRELLDAGKPSVCTRIHSRWPFITEAVGATGRYDYVEFAGEYAPFTQQELEGIAMAAELTGMAAMIKVDMLNRGYVCQKAMAAGFNALLLVDHRTPEDVKESLRLIRPDSPEDGGAFGFPVRRFNFAGSWASYSFEEYKKLLRSTVVAVMIEKKEAVENLKEILAVPGIDMVQWGPADYALSSGWERKEKKDELKEVERYVIETAIKCGVQPRAEINTAAQAAYYKKLGVKHFSLGDEVMNNLAYWRTQGEELRGVLGE